MFGAFAARLGQQVPYISKVVAQSEHAPRTAVNGHRKARNFNSQHLFKKPSLLNGNDAPKPQTGPTTLSLASF